MSDFRSLKAKVRVLCKQRRVRLEEFMKTFDRHRVKKIKVEQFRRALDLSGLQLAPSEVDVILMKYRIPTEPAYVDYQRFCDLINKVFTVKGLEQNPHLCGSIQSELKSTKKLPKDQFVGQELESLKRVKAKIVHAVQVKGVVLKDVFHDFDRANAGKVTKPQFLRHLLDIVTLSDDECELLLKAYGDGRDLYYRTLHYDLFPSTSTPVALPSLKKRLHLHYRDDESVEEIEDGLRKLVARDRIRVKEFFVDFDPLRTGTCSEAQFLRCLKLTFPSLLEHELAVITAKYRCSDSAEAKTNYLHLCRSLERSEAFSNNDMDDDSLAKMMLQTQTAINDSDKCYRKARGALTADEEVVYQGLMERIANYCTTRRVLIKPTFQDFDRAKRDHITNEQFIRVLTMFKLSPQSRQEEHVLLKRYASAHGDRFINYVAFCSDVEHWNDSENTNQSSSRPSSSNVASEILAPSRVAKQLARSPSELMLDIQRQVKRDRVRLEEYYRDFDKLRHNEITRAQFAAGIHAAGLLLSKEEVASLADQYASDVKDSQGLPLVSWKIFVEAVERVFTITDLEKYPTYESLLKPQEKKVSIEKKLSEAEEKQVTEAVLAMKKSVDRQRLTLKPVFEDFDRARHGSISAPKFERALSRLGLLPPDDRIAKLVLIKFQESSNGKGLGSIGDVNYRAFLDALDIVSSLGPADILPGSSEYRHLIQSGGDSHLQNGGRRTIRMKNESSSELTPLLQELHRQVNTQRIRLKEFVTEGDKLRTGEVSVPKFHTALNRSGCTLSAADLKTLSTAFRSDKHTDMINWRAFIDAVENVQIMTLVTPRADDNVDKLLASIRGEVLRRGLHLKPYFQDYDRNSTNCVTKTQFAAVLDLMRLSLTPRDIDCLTSYYGNDSKGRKDVHYLTFLQQVDPSQT